MMFDSIVGYVWRANVWCAGCVEKALGTSGISRSAESLLDALALKYNIDRQDEHSFDSDDFPKVILAINIDGVEYCGTCGLCLIDDEAWPCPCVYPALEDAARRIGTEHGKNTAAWIEQDLWGGRASGDGIDAAAAYLADDYDMDSLPRALDLSGEWADGLTPNDVLGEILSAAGEERDADSLDPDITDELLTIAQDSAENAMADALTDSALSLAGKAADESAMLDGRYAVTGHEGIAFYLTDVYASGTVRAIMVGDDHVWSFDRSDLTLLADGEWCSECGQVGCTGDRLGGAE